jgi:N-methylhydantoinase A
VVLGYIAGGDLAGGDISIDAGVAHDVIQETIATPLQLNVTDAALGIHRIANANMLRALREVSVYRGRDPREFALVAFGGCGPVHACLLAAELGTQRVLIPPVPGLFSAIGLLVSGIEHHDVRSCRLAAEQGASASISTLVDEMRTPMLDQFHEESVPRESVSLRVACDVRYTGEISEIRVQADDDQTTPERVQQIREAFEAEHIRLYGHGGNPGSTIEIVAVRLVGRTAGDDSIARGGARSGTATGTRSAVFGERWGAIEAPIINRNDLGEGRKGPFLIDEYDATIVIPPNWRGATDTTGNIILELNDGKD